MDTKQDNSDIFVGKERAMVARAVEAQHRWDKMSEHVVNQDSAIQARARMDKLIKQQGFVVCNGAYKQGSSPVNCIHRVAALTKRVFLVEFLRDYGDRLEPVLYYGQIADINKPTFDLYDTATAEGNRPVLCVFTERNRWLAKPYYNERVGESIDQATGKWSARTQWKPRGYWTVRIDDVNKIQRFFQGDNNAAK